MTIEIELKLEVDPRDLALVRKDPLLAHAESCSNEQVTVYYDTAATKLKKNDFTLRVRSAGGLFVQTVKPITDSVGLISREETECEVASIAPDLSSPSFDIIRGLLLHEEVDDLKEIIRSEVTRTTWEIDRYNGRMQIDLDHGTITAGEHCTEFAELEFELSEGAPASLVVAARRLSDHVPVRLGVLTKAERGFLLADDALGKISKAVPVRVTSGMTVAEAFEAIVHGCLKHYRLNEPLILRNSKAGALHQARVAMRRLRSALTLFRPAVEDVEFQHLRHELRWFTGQLGDARNLDVYLRNHINMEHAAELTQKRKQAYDQVVEAMNSARFRRLLIDLVGWAALGAWRSAKPASRPVERLARRRLDRQWKSIIVAGRDIGRMDERTRHKLRIQVKKLRYAVEFVRDLFPDARPRERRFSAAIRELLKSLGKLNDMGTAKTFGTGSADESWLIGSPDERRNLIIAEDSLRDLLHAGPFWHASGKLKPA